jgi:hypothetical protein
MTSIQEQEEDVRQAKIAKRLRLECNGGLITAVKAGGRLLTGFSVKLNGYDCLMTLRATKGDIPEVAFVGAETLTALILKAAREARKDELHWRADQWAR